MLDIRPTLGAPNTSPNSNHLDNRALLCSPCNITKGNRITTSQLRRENAKSGYPAKRTGSRRRSTFSAKPPVQPTTADGAQEPEMDRIPNIIAEFNKT